MSFKDERRNRQLGEQAVLPPYLNAEHAPDPAGPQAFLPLAVGFLELRHVQPANRMTTEIVT